MTRTTSPSAVPTARKVGATKKSSFPVLSEAELTKELIRPFCLSELQFRPTSKRAGRQRIFTHVDLRTVLNRLDSLVPMQYEVNVEQQGEIFIVNLKVLGVSRSGVSGLNDKNDEDFDRVAASFSIGLKRAAVQFGIGRYLYELPEMWGEVYSFEREAIMPASETERLRGEYLAWMNKKENKERWGEVVERGTEIKDAKNSLLLDRALGIRKYLQSTTLENYSKCKELIQVQEEEIRKFIAPDLLRLEPVNEIFMKQLQELTARAKGLYSLINMAENVEELSDIGAEVNKETNDVPSLLRPVYAFKLKKLRDETV